MKISKRTTEKGITLVALVITIVILIILATVTINMAFGEDEIIARAQQAKELTEQATLEEQEGLNSLMSEYANIMAEEQTPPVPVEPVDTTEQEPTPIEEVTKGEEFNDTTKVEAPIDSDGDNPEQIGTIYVPGGFGIAEESPNDINDGIVISNADDTKQFVWIPVSSEELAEMYVEAPGTALSSNVEEGFEVTVITDVYSKLRDETNNGNSFYDTNTYKPGNEEVYREPDITTNKGSSSIGDVKELGTIKNVFATELAEYGISPSSLDVQVLNAWAQMLVDEYNETYESIKKYGGFYIGRYEISGSADNPTVKPGGTVLTNASLSTDNW